ncbi:MAG: class I SAM-dependent methyltransferase [Acidobacteria bacterium]|nr:class I SAM-dependent methyltransferase [Acidobacteriota bacterium]MCG3192963.1 Ubiquinone/menaquinone biosynthesis C-methyltransferase UbiE [Thermoanaerobaculia bacterium]MCK6683801.1 class I SAM-dependent methyltransferase [Thermoanaerobaculia bacterium]
MPEELRDPWWASWFGEEYLALYPNRDEQEAEIQAAFAVERLAAYARLGKVGFLDLACGTGRHAIALNDSFYGVAGLDLSLPLLRAARRRVTKPRPGYTRGDMRRLPYQSGVFGSVVNFFTSFGYFDDPMDDLAVLEEIRRVLVPGGVFLSDLFNAERVLSALVQYEEKTIAGERVSIRRWYDPSRKRLEKEITMEPDGAAKTYRESVRVYREEELRILHQEAGFLVLESFGDFDGTPFNPKRSPRLILMAEALKDDHGA